MVPNHENARAAWPDDGEIVWWLVTAERVRLAISQWAGKQPICGTNAAAGGAGLRMFIFDSSRHLNCHSNFIPKIAVLGQAPGTGTWRSDKSPYRRTGRKKGGSRNDGHGNGVGGRRTGKCRRLLRSWHGLFRGRGRRG